MASTVTAGAGWVRRFCPAPDAGVRLVCFPHAGGAASFYFPVAQELSPAVDVLAIQYPGRQDRLAEPPLTDLHALAQRSVAELGGWLDRPVALFGHSMGAVVAFEVARLLRARAVAPVALFVSARRPPQVYRHDDVHRRSDDKLLAEMRRLGGSLGGLLDDATFQSMVLPSLRGDYQAVETYRYRQAERLSCPLVVLTGDTDPLVDLAEVHRWREHTTGAFELRVLPGGHFYLTDQQQAVLSAIRDRLGG